MRILKKGSTKYKGNFPFKIFNYGRIGHYVVGCTFKEDNHNRSNDDNKRKDDFTRDDKDNPKRNFCLMETYSF